MNSQPDASRSHILSVDEGLERLMGDRALYMQLLRRFRQDYQQAAVRIRQALEAGQVEPGRRLAHTLKGATGMIGAQQAHAAAQTLEASCQQGSTPCMEALAALEQAMATLLGMIETVLDSSEATAATAAAAVAAPTPRASAQLLLQHLAHLLDEGNGAAIDVLEQSASVLAASLGVAVFQEVAAAAHQFDFEAALEALKPKL
jgi:HPt (histidine-containing phosphotransfer) domain-containing protein